MNKFLLAAAVIVASISAFLPGRVVAQTTNFMTATGAFAADGSFSVKVNCPVLVGNIRYFLDRGPASLTKADFLSGTLAGQCFPASPITISLGQLPAGGHIVRVIGIFTTASNADYTLVSTITVQAAAAEYHPVNTQYSPAIAGATSASNPSTSSGLVTTFIASPSMVPLDGTSVLSWTTTDPAHPSFTAPCQLTGYGNPVDGSGLADGSPPIGNSSGIKKGLSITGMPNPAAGYASGNQSYTTPPLPSAKTYWLWCSNGSVDSRNQLTVNIDTSSVTTSATQTVSTTPAPLPDLTVNSTSNTSAATAGSATVLSATIADVNAPTGASFTTLFQRATSAAGANAIDIGTVVTPAMSAGGLTTVTLSYTFPTAGTFYIRACADKSSAGSTGVIAESNANNNCGVWAAVTAANGTCANGAADFPTCTPPVVDTCGPASSPTPLSSQPAGTSACSVGTLNSTSPADTSLVWNWSCGAVSTCSAPKYGCTTTADSHYNPSGPNNTWGCANTCSNGANNYPTCSFPACANGATNPPACSSCPSTQTIAGGTCTCPNGFAYIGGACTACSNGGCTGTGGTATNPTGSLTCGNLSVGPVVSWLGSHGCVLAADGSGCNVTAAWTVTGAPLGTSVDLKIANPTLPGGGITHTGLPVDAEQIDHVTTAGSYTFTLLDDTSKIKLGETLAMAVCAPGSTIDPVTQLCVAPGAPSTPTLSALWQGSTYLGPSASAHDPNGYQLLAQATSPSGANLAYYFEWYGTGESGAAQWSEWVGSGGWGSVTHYIDYGPGTYHARVWAVDSNGLWSAAPSEWITFTLSQPALSVSCVGTPGNAYIGQQVTWNSTVTGGSGSIVYVWSGSDDLFATVASIQKTYTTPGPKTAALSITDSRTGQTASANCTNGDTGGTSITVKTCTSSLSASPSTVDEGQNTTLSWSVSDGPLCAASCSGNGFNTAGAVSGTAASLSVPQPPTTTYALTCTGGTYGPPPTANTTVTVQSPTATITVNGQSGSARINPGTISNPAVNNATIVWAATRSVSCDITKNGVAWMSNLTADASGNIVGTAPDTITSATDYAIDCVNQYGVHSTSKLAKVNVLPVFNEF